MLVCIERRSWVKCCVAWLYGGKKEDLGLWVQGNIGWEMDLVDSFESTKVDLSFIFWFPSFATSMLIDKKFVLE